jgi:zinc protease
MMKTRHAQQPLIPVLLLFLAMLLLPLASQAGPTIQHWTTSNGARVYFVPAPDLPMVDVRMVFDAGSARDGQQPGLAQLSNSLLDSGSGDLDADQIATRFEQVGARFSTEAYRDMAIVELRSLIDPDLLNPAVQTAAQLLANPSFPQSSFDRETQRLLVTLQQRQQSPGDIADDAFMAAVYEGHPYATPTPGTEAGVKTIRRNDVVDFHRRYYVGRNATVAIVGALDRAAAERLSWALVKDMQDGRAAPLLSPVTLQPAQSTGTGAAISKSRTIVIEHPSTQTHILIGQAGMSRDDPDYFPLYVGNHTLGGSGLVSRISEEIREKRGLSYSAYSYFTPMRQQGPFTIGLQTRNDQTDEALKVARDTLQQFIQTGPTATELEESKQNITGGFPLRLSSNNKIVDMLALVGFYQLPLDYLDTFSTRVNAVTIDAIREAFARRLNPQQMITVRVGGSTAKP